MADLVMEVGSPGGHLVFTFSQIHTVSGTAYFTSVSGPSGQHFFRMENRNGSWQIVQAPKPPDWVLTYEAQLAKFLKESLQT